MLELNIPSLEFYDEAANEFIYVEGGLYRFEHSLKAISLWEAKYKTPFLHYERTDDELKDYFQCMSVDRVIPRILLTQSVSQEISEYMADTQTATTITDTQSKKSSKRIITSEVLYAMMAMSQVPFDCDKWHINRLLMVLQIIGIESNPNKPKMSKRDIMSRNKALNEARRKQFNTKG